MKCGCVVTLFLIFAFGCLAWPASHQSCFSNADFRDESDIAKYIHKTTDYYEGSKRQLIDSMPAQDQDRFAATGTFRCGNKTGSAQLTLKNGLITTAAHLFNDRENCATLANPSDCIFTIKARGKTQNIPVAGMVDSGFKCPPPAGRKLPNKSYRDWAVLRLKFPAENVTPYQIDEAKVQSMKRGQSVITIGHSADFHAKIVGGKWSLPKHYGTCTIGNIDSTFEPYFVSTSCGCAEGCSGGSLLTNEPVPSLLGIYVQNNESKEKLDRAIKSGTPNIEHFDSDSNSSDCVPFTGDFLKAVRRGAEEQDI